MLEADEEEEKGYEDALKNKKRKKSEAGPEEEDDDDDSSYEWMGGDLALYDGPLEDVDELTRFGECLSHLQNAQPGFYGNLWGCLSPEEQE